MDVVHVNVPLRTGKKMKKRKELDALVANSIAKRSCGGGATNGNVKRSGNGISSQDQLLSESTDEQEAYWNQNGNNVMAKRPRSAHVGKRRTLLSLMRACTALLVFTCVVATITVMWLLIDVREQITSLRSELDQVVGSNQGVPEALQKCHSVSRGLQQNQTQLAQQLNTFRQQLDNFTLQVNEIKNGLNEVQKKLKENPDLVNIPQQVTFLSNSVAGFGGQMKDVITTVQSLKDQNTKFLGTTNEIIQNVTTLQTAVSQVQSVNSTSSPNDAIPKELTELRDGITNLVNRVQTNMTLINETLSKQLQWTIDDQHTDHKLLESLQEVNQSVFARISNLENSCSKTANDQNESFSMIRNLTQEIQDVVLKSQTVDTQLMTLQAKVRDLDTKSTQQSELIRRVGGLPTSTTTTSTVPTVPYTSILSTVGMEDPTPVLPHTKPKTLSSS